jgi:GTP pyrophosphokinase
MGISLTGIEDVMVRFAKCCHPIPGDEILGYISRGRGLTVHTVNCLKIEEMDLERIVDVQWNVSNKQTFPLRMMVVCSDKKGLLAELSALISSMDINISHAEIDTRSNNMNQAICNFNLDVHDLKQFNHLTNELKKIKSVKSVERVRRV